MNKVLEIKNLTKTYGANDNIIYALKDTNLEASEGELIVILGPSGAGKSTLLNLIGGLDNPTSGEIKVDGIDISSFSDKELANYRANKVGFVFQFYNLIPTLTVLENVELVNEIAPKHLDAKEVLTSVGLHEHFNKFPQELSGGEQQRVSIARALTKNPKIILCDEPTGALDSKTGVKVLEVLKEMTRRFNKAVIIVTHNSNIALIADKVVRVKNGSIQSITKNEKPLEVSEVDW